MMEMLSSAENVSISVQKELKSFEKKLNEAAATKPADPNTSSSPGTASHTKPAKLEYVKQVPEHKPLEFTKPVPSAGVAKGAASHAKFTEQNQVKPFPGAKPVKDAATQVSSAGQDYAKLVSSAKLVKEAAAHAKPAEQSQVKPISSAKSVKKAASLVKPADQNQANSSSGANFAKGTASQISPAGQNNVKLVLSPKPAKKN